MDVSKEENGARRGRRDLSERDKAFSMTPQPNAWKWPWPVRYACHCPVINTPWVACTCNQPHAMAIPGSATRYTEHSAATLVDARRLHGHVALPPMHPDPCSPDLPPYLVGSGQGCRGSACRLLGASHRAAAIHGVLATAARVAPVPPHRYRTATAASHHHTVAARMSSATVSTASPVEALPFTSHARSGRTSS